MCCERKVNTTLKAIRWSLLDFATFSRPTELAHRRLLAVNVPFGLGILLGSGCRGQNIKMFFDNTKPMKISFIQNLRGLFIEQR
jgi:hypothetical protein